MSLQRFSSFEAAEQGMWCFKPDAAYYQKVAELFDLGFCLFPPDFPRGIYKFNSLSEADAHLSRHLLIKQATNLGRT